ncbi:MAG: OmpH family outer membrane protein [Candidatus Kapaibacterium sp.]
MRKLAQRMALGAIMAFGLFASSAHAQKIGVVDINAVVTGMPEYTAANTQIEAQRKAFMDTLQTMQTEYQTKVDTYQKLGETASADFKKKEAADLDSLSAAFNKFRDDKLGQQGQLAQMQANLMKPITDKLQNTLASYAKKEKLAIILPKTATVYNDPTIDYTAKFQDYLKAQAVK